MKKSGFTLIELLAVIVILGIVVAIAIPGINSVISSSRKKALDSEAKIIHQAAIRKLVGNPNYSYSHINRDNLKSELETNGTKFDYIGISNNNGYLTVTLTKDGYTTTSSNDPSILNAKVYGLKINFNTNTYERLGDAKNKVAAVGVDTSNPLNQFDTEDIFGEIIDVVEDGNHFVRIPKFYINKISTANTLELRISKKAEEGYYLPNVFINHETGTESNYVLIGKYSGTLTDGKLGSKPGLSPRVSATISTLRDEARASGNGYQLIDIHAIDVIQTLFYIEFATLDSQSIMKGFSYGNVSFPVSGQTDSVTAKSGSKTSNTTGKFMMKYRGIENLYGYIFQAVDGININAYNIYVSNKPDAYVSDKYDGDYKLVNYQVSTASDFVLRTGYDNSKPFINLPTVTGSESSSLYKDKLAINSSKRAVFFGGHLDYGQDAGIGTWIIHSTSAYNNTYTGSRVMKTH